MMVTRTVVLATLPAGVTPEDIRQRRKRGELPFGGGVQQRGNGWSLDDRFHVLDLIAVRLAERLRSNTDLRAAARMTTGLFPTWAEAVAACEGLEPEEREAVFLILIDAGGDDYIVRWGPLNAQLVNLPEGTRTIRTISIGRIITELRADAEKAGVELPEQFTPRFGTPEFMAWIEAIGGDTARVRAAEQLQKKKALLAELDMQMKLAKAELQDLQNGIAEMARAAAQPEPLAQSGEGATRRGEPG
jgi:hypothetical protein